MNFVTIYTTTKNIFFDISFRDEEIRLQPFFFPRNTRIPLIVYLFLRVAIELQEARVKFIEDDKLQMTN